MKKKFLLSILFLFVLVLFSTVCFAANTDNKNNNTMTKQIGNEITSSIKETEKSVDNLINTDILNENKTTDKNTRKDNMGNDIGDDVKKDTEEVRNRVVAGTTGNYNAGERTNGTGMSMTTWVWIILAVLAVIIIAAVWYYASQRND